jgi:hypothetical protein
MTAPSTPNPPAPSARSAPPPRPPRRKPPLAFKLIVLVFVAVFGLVFAEIAVRVYVNAKKLTLSVGPMQTRPDAYYGNWLRPNIASTVTNSNGIRYRERTNSVGHRGPEYVDAPQGHIICLGDSYTMGETVDAGKEYASLLRDALRPAGYEVVNFGRAGNGQGRWLKFLTRDAASYAPKFIVMQFCYNDFGDNQVEGLYRLRDDGSLEALPVPGPRAVDRIRDLVESIPGVPYLYSYQVIKQTIRGKARAHQGFHPDREELTPEQRAAQDALAMALIRASMEHANASGAQIIWTSVGLPEDRAAMIRSLAAEFGAIEVPVPYLDELPELYHEKDPHWNEAGHRYVADAILDAIGLPDPTSPAP